MWICIAHQRIIPLTTSSARNQPTLQDHGYGPVYHAMCPFTSPSFRWVLILHTHGGKAQV